LALNGFESFGLNQREKKKVGYAKHLIPEKNMGILQKKKKIEKFFFLKKKEIKKRFFFFLIKSGLTLQR
jgi:hypothetical protein